MKLNSRIRKQEILTSFVSEVNNHAINKILSMVAEDILIKSDGFGMWKEKLMVDKFLSKLFLSFPDFRMKFLNHCYGNGNPGITMSEISILGQQMGRSWEIHPVVKNFQLIVYLFLNLTNQ